VLAQLDAERQPQPSRFEIRNAALSVPLEDQRLLGPQRPVCELLERGAVCDFDEQVVTDAARVEAAPAAADLDTVR
jgi:hypothetical protein